MTNEETPKEVKEEIHEHAKEPQKLSFEFYVAGVQHHQLHTCIKEIKPGDTLQLIPEPTNRFDPNAVRIEYPSLHQDSLIMLGYVPNKKGDYSSKVSAALMIKNLKCEVIELNPDAKTWEQLKVCIEEDI